MECPTCGAPIRVGSRLCTSCGTWLLDDDLRVEKSVPSFSPAAERVIPAAEKMSFEEKVSFDENIYVVPPPGTASPPRPAPPPSQNTAPFTLPMNSPPPTAPAGAAAGGASWAPPSAAQRVDQPPPGGVGAFTSAFSQGPVANDVDDDEFEHTTLSARRSTKPAVFWTLTLPNGAVELVTDRPIVIGREPVYMAALPQARLIPVADPMRSVSKNHACFSMYGATLVVEDLGSTNGIIVTRADGRENDIGVGGRAELEVGSRVELGDVVIVIGRA